MLCQQKFVYECGLERGVGSYSEPLDLGTLLHSIFEARLLGTDWREARYACEAKLVKSRPRGFDDAWAGAVSFVDDIEPWIDEWAPEFPLEVVAVEKEFRASLGGLELAGRVDGIVRWNGQLWPLQHKSMAQSKVVHVFAEKQRTDWHEIFYQHCIEQMFPGERVGGTMLHCVRKLSKKALGEGKNPFSWHYLARTEAIQAEGMRDIQATLWAAHSLLHNVTSLHLPLDTYPYALAIKNREACGGFYGSSLCPFKGVCDGEEQMDNGKFVQLKRRYV